MDLDPAAGSEQTGHRPVLVVSADAYNRKVGMAVVCPVTNKAKGYPFEVPLPEGLAVKGVILSDHLGSKDWRSRRARLICRAPDSVVDEVLGRVAVLFQS
jgi:mRNA interferase MazF